MPDPSTNRNADGLTPAEVFAAAKPGDVVRFTMRGPEGVPWSPEDITSTEAALEEQYPGVDIEIDPLPGPQSYAEVVRKP
jgi:hypothetical protein